MLTSTQQSQALLALTQFRYVGWMHWQGCIKDQCFPVSQFMLPIVAQYNSDARVYVGYVGVNTKERNVVVEIERFMKFPCSFLTPPDFHAWIADKSTGEVLADYVLPFGTGHRYYSDVHNPSGIVYTPVLKDYFQVADFAAALLVHNMCIHRWRLLNTCAVPLMQGDADKKRGWLSRFNSFFGRQL
ncbi:hypothetical protein [Pseudomonas viridiflava]|uniref:hypothetical protein n=1 Tax=Pseudomonas viridiflava TaxID=33069 RepID=UPI000F019476|nr:hypothetical protein [Pseudomonas viridiflava]